MYSIVKSIVHQSSYKVACNLSLSIPWFNKQIIVSENKSTRSRGTSGVFTANPLVLGSGARMLLLTARVCKMTC